MIGRPAEQFGHFQPEGPAEGFQPVSGDPVDAPRKIPLNHGLGDTGFLAEVSIAFPGFVVGVEQLTGDFAVIHVEASSDA